MASRSRSSVGLAGALVAGVALMSSSEAAPPSTTTVLDPVSGLSLVVQLPTSDAARCSGRRWIGRSSSGLCPDSIHPAWRSRRLFRGPHVPSALRSFCLYEWTAGSPPSTGALPSEGGVPATVWLDPDCEVAVPMSAPGSPGAAVATELAAAFEQQVDAMKVLPGFVPTVPVRVDVLDTSPTARSYAGIPASGPSPHGFAVGSVVRRLACPAGGGPCPRVQVHTTLALPYEGPALLEDYVRGGHFGSLGHFAEAVQDALDASLGSGQNLVLNLSLGWDPRYDDPAASEAVAAAYEALKVATCRGALVVAAAGNDTGGPRPSLGPACPACWESETVTSCAGYGPGTTLGRGRYRPLVHAVGGVDGSDVALANARVGGRPRLAAAGAHVSVPDPAGVPTVILTGSSMAAAVVSSAAALVWGYHPSLAPHEVMDIVYVSGTSLAPAADFGWAGVVDPRRRITIGAAVHGACLGPGCPMSPPSHPPGEDRRLASSLAMASWLPPSGTSFVSAGALRQSLDVGAMCLARVHTSTVPTTPFPRGLVCPAQQFHSGGDAPRNEPQPGTALCPGCPVTLWGRGEAVLAIHPKFSDRVESPSLRFELTTGTTTLLDLSSMVGALSPGDTLVVEDLDARLPLSTIKSAFLEGLGASSKRAVRAELLLLD